jgi:hypothetical protein
MRQLVAGYLYYEHRTRIGWECGRGFVQLFSAGLGAAASRQVVDGCGLFFGVVCVLDIPARVGDPLMGVSKCRAMVTGEVMHDFKKLH